MKIAVLGAKGLLGTALVPLLKSRGHEVLALDKEECDVTSLKALHEVLAPFGPESIVLLAAYTAVDKAEEEPSKCFWTNGYGAANVAFVAELLHSEAIYISSDYVFDGKKDGYYETDDTHNPLSVYGASKVFGENCFQKFTVVRTSWLYGTHGPDFVRTMIRLAKEGRDLKVVDDQIGAPTYAPHLALALSQIIEKKLRGIYHARAEGVMSWYEFAKLIFDKTGIHPRSLTPVPSKDYKTLAVRPLNSRLSNQSLISAGVALLPHIEIGLDEYLRQLAYEGVL